MKNHPNYSVSTLYIRENYDTVNIIMYANLVHAFSENEAKEKAEAIDRSSICENSEWKLERVIVLKLPE